MRVDIRQLHAIVDDIFHHIIDKRGVDSIELDAELYWNIPEESRYDVLMNPPELDIGSLSDDWDLVSNMSKDDANIIAYQLAEIAPLLAYVGVRLASELAEKGG